MSSDQSSDIAPCPAENLSGHGKGTVAVRATAANLLLMTYGRIPPPGDAFTVFGDTDLLTCWLEKYAL